MKKLVAIGFLTVILALSVGQAMATKPGQDVNPNGFPSGPHFNLNIIGKKAGFTCPEQEYKVTVCIHGDIHLGDIVTKESCPDGDTCVPVYGNVIFVPESGEGIEILMQSGKAGGRGKKSEELPEVLQVIDPCAVFDGDGAVLQLPKNEQGYDVYGRALATPTDNPNMIITPSLFGAEDENGDPLIFLGTVTSDGFATTSQPFVREKGKSTAIEITGLFEWKGIVWYTYDPGDHQHEAWLHEESPGVWSICDAPGETPVSGELCTHGYTLVYAYGVEYSDYTWVFNIADFVEYLWDLNNNGLKLLQIRFYPIGADPELAPSRHNTLATQWGRIRAE